MPSFFDANTTSHAQVMRDRRIAEALAARATGGASSFGEGLSVMGAALGSLVANNRADKAEKSGKASANEMLAKALSMPASGSESVGEAPSASLPASASNLKSGIAETAGALGISPKDLATVISYETGGTFDPMQAGPTTQWGQHKGLIQFGEPQAKQYGVDWNDPAGSQLGADGAIAKYLTQAGVKPGMGLMDVYSAVNAGQVGRYSASDAQNGGAPGTVADKVNTQMAGHIAKAAQMFPDATPQQQQSLVSMNPQAGLTPSAMAEILGNPYLTDAQRQFALSEYQRRQGPTIDQQLDRDYKRAQIDNIQNKQPKRQTIKGADGYQYFQDTGDRVLPNVVKAPDADSQPSSVQEYIFAQQNDGYKGTYTDWKAAQKSKQSITVGPDGSIQILDGPGAFKGISKEYEGKKSTFATRAAGALEKLEASAKGLEGTSGVIGNTVGQIPFVGNFLKSDEFQLGEQAGEEFLQAILRDDTGAAITEQEQRLYAQTYIPEPGDGAPELEQKKHARIRALEALRGGMTYDAFRAMTNSLNASGDKVAAEKANSTRSVSQNPAAPQPATTQQQNTQHLQQSASDPQKLEDMSREQIMQFDATAMKAFESLTQEEINGLPDDVLEALAERWEQLNGG